MAIKKQPGFDGQFEPGSREVESPYSGKSEAVPFNYRESNARTLRLGKGQTKTYDHMWSLWYRLGHNRQMAVDTTKDPVDGGGLKDPIPERAMKAAQELEAVRKAIGADRYHLIKMTCLDGWSYIGVAAHLFGSDFTRREFEEASISVKNAYNAAMYHLGYAKPHHTIAKLNAYREPDAVPTDRQDLRKNE